MGVVAFGGALSGAGCGLSSGAGTGDGGAAGRSGAAGNAGLAGTSGGAGGSGGSGSGGASGTAGSGGTLGSGTGGAGGLPGGAGGTAGLGGSGGFASGGRDGGTDGAADAPAPFCPTGQLECRYGTTSTCHPAAFTFESGTTDGFTLDATSSSLPDASIVSTMVRAHGGSWSLLSPITGPGGSVVMTVPLCGQLEVANLEGSTLSLWVYLESTMPLPYPLSTYVQIGLATQGGGIPSHQHTPLPDGLPIGSWSHFTETIDVAGAGQTHFGNLVTSMYVAFGLPFPLTGVSPWVGRVYFDDITITPAM